MTVVEYKDEADRFMTEHRWQRQKRTEIAVFSEIVALEKPFSSHLNILLGKS